MPSDEAEEYWLAITRIEAYEMLQQLKVSSYPHSKRESRDSLYRSLHKQAFPQKAVRVLTPQELEAIVNG